MAKNALALTKKYLYSGEIQERLANTFADKQKSAAFSSSIMTLITNSTALQNCEPSSIMNSAMIAAALDLPIDPNLGYAAIVPYNSGYGQDRVQKAQFQMMYKGFVQLALRTGQYKKIHATEIYEDELERYNPIMGVVEFVEDCKYEQRNEGKSHKVVGYYAWFEMQGGLRQELYMPKKNMENHAKKYSKSYQYDLKKGKNSSNWTTNFDAMGIKTVIKMLLSKWGLLSVDNLLHKAIQDDQKIDGEYQDNPTFKEQDLPDSPPSTTEPVDVAFEEVKEEQQTPEAPPEQQQVFDDPAF